jgi:hypothetical protein
MSSITAVPIKPTRRSVLIYLWIAIVLALVGATALAMQAPEDFLVKNARQHGVVTTASGLQYKELSPGDGGTKPTDTDVALINYEGKLLDGTTFDKSPQPTPMAIAGVVPGFGEALKLMTRGSRYQFWLKPDLAYGDKANGLIPAKSVLVFTVDLIDFKSAAWLREQQMRQQQMMQQGGGMPQGALPPGALPPGAVPQN